MDAQKQLIIDEKFMRRALRLAKKGTGCVSPNPLVGAVIVKDGRIIGEGWHQRCGENHAEINAIQGATEAIAGSTFYVTLEPCSHHGRTPPCAEALVAHHPARVVIGTPDPNPLVSGRGMEILRKNKIEISIGILETECIELNRFFFKHIRTGLPYVTLKFAQTLDGRIATSSGDSCWISSPPSLRYAHQLRAIHDAILVGAGAVRMDNPKLTCRLVKGRDPLRIVLDSRLALPPDREIFSDGGRTLAACTGLASLEKKKLMQQRGVDVLECEGDSRGHVSLSKLLENLGKRGISSVLVEGGAGVATAFLQEDLVDQLLVVVAPKIVGTGINAIGGLGIEKIAEALSFSFHKISRRGDDLIIDIRLNPRQKNP
ncbi:MAG: bifunctional diaminohydroxyphosphoribosylaminopyrimidine deaminase/5-amino-6-(5-phosphoribosylamino)uracil reductase RibD [Syntrophales bacterium]|jgi:diaminohydroxyphosphoribosylaminopyrimidine deaminase/5-amino-6-(5-phosphoribosylamino)uracil reductase|nr:bifunctional diaminohydroxyphosphoribosylaminopyrimidine deaminase/5-amino-6-(5-phosphoribosylamino)uracil reductase RibD [Syntrophales bacterium]